ncbi:hypothetical protein KIN20_028792 [Parelaphostrongylus tenuis]|uniref:Uncharacterized protein n=1 Tax=Parelaphostrongylus tenuis TaxID=148309 RepID=A0AAD5R1B1_PARTN|nr:hypothetical protein KIN20_028792 [Parelaphostrongylus tenuis]
MGRSNEKTPDRETIELLCSISSSKPDEPGSPTSHFKGQNPPQLGSPTRDSTKVSAPLRTIQPHSIGSYQDNPGIKQ